MSVLPISLIYMLTLRVKYDIIWSSLVIMPEVLLISCPKYTHSGLLARSSSAYQM